MKRSSVHAPLGGTSAASRQIEAAVLQPWGDAVLRVEGVLVA